MGTHKDQLKKGMIANVIAFALCAVVATFRYITGIDIMSLTVFRSKTLGNLTGEDGTYSFWPISHFVLYVVLGCIAPRWWWLWVCIGLAWELFEYSCGVLVRKLLRGKNTADFGKKAEQMFMPQYSDGEWVTGRKSDIIFNIAGLGFGLVLSNFCKTEPAGTGGTPGPSKRGRIRKIPGQKAGSRAN